LKGGRTEGGRVKQGLDSKRRKAEEETAASERKTKTALTRAIRRDKGSEQRHSGGARTRHDNGAAAEAAGKARWVRVPRESMAAEVKAIFWRLKMRKQTFFSLS